jgi:trk system potassium uptake protein TrkA
MRIVAIYRREQGTEQVLSELTGTTRIEPGDEVFVLAATERIRTVLGALRKMDRPVRRVMIAGGGKVGLRLARQVEGEVEVKLIEASRTRCDYLASQLPSSTLVLHGDSTDEELMGDENVGGMDLFIALTSDDEDNILAGLLAKRMGARRVIALINRRAYVDIVQGTPIDIAISPSHTVIGELLTYVRRGDVEAVHALRHGAAEALEAVVRGDASTSRIAGRRVEQVEWPAGAQIGAIVRGLPVDCDASVDGRAGARAEVIVPHHDTEIRAGDRVVVFMPRKKMVRQVERLFQVSATFF